MNVTIRTGPQGERHCCDVEWFDENNVPLVTRVEVNVRDQDKPRTLEIVVDGLVLAVLTSRPNLRGGMPLALEARRAGG